MDPVKYQLRFQRIDAIDGVIPVRVLAELLGRISECAERSLRFAIEGVSVKTGPTPAWLEEAVNLALSGIENGVIHLEARTLESVIGTDIQQADFWLKAPASTDTALSLFARSVRDTTGEILESDHYDAGVLRGLLGLKSLLKSQLTSVELIANGRPDEHVTLSIHEMEKAERLKVRTPEPQPCTISGRVDAIQHGRKRFQLVRSTGQVIPGTIHEDFISPEKLRQFWAKEVTVKGMLHFKASGQIQLLEATEITARSEEADTVHGTPLVQLEAEFPSSRS